MNVSTWAVLAVFAAAGLLYVVARVVREIRLRRAERAWAEGIARKVMQRQAEIAWSKHMDAMDSAEDRS